MSRGRSGTTPYDAAWFSRHLDGMTRSARIVLELLYGFYRPRSVIDIGCGRGAWLAAAGSLGSTRLKGVDGDWVREGDLLPGTMEFLAVNLDESMPQIDERFDLCLALEVAEHIPETSARPFIATLCRASDIVLFSAAIKFQGGKNHRNEQWQSYWLELFKEQGYECHDIFRAVLWNNKDVEWWYRQNMFLYVGPRNTLVDVAMLKRSQKPLLDVVHPINYENKVREREHPTLKSCLGCLKRYIRNALAGS